MTTRFIILLLAVAATLPAWSADYMPRPHRLQAQAKAAAEQIWRHGTQTTYEYFDGWELTEISRFTYDRQGRQLTQYLDAYDSNGTITNRSRYTYEYGSDNRRFTRRQTDTSIEGIYYDPSELTRRRYDERIDYAIVENIEATWGGVDWIEQGNCYQREITRNDDGNVVSVVVSVPYNGYYTPIQRTTLTYGDDGLPTTMLLEVLTQGDEPGTFVWGVSQEYLECKWNQFNGQILSVEDLPYYGNRLASAKIRVAEGVYGTLSYTYPDEMGSYRAVQKFTDNGLIKDIVATMTVLDDNGSYDFVIEEISGLGSVIERYAETEKFHLDAFGNNTLIYASSTTNGRESIEMWMTGEIEYNATTGYPEVYTLSERNAETGDFELRMRVEFTDIVDAAGVEAIGSDSNAPAEYFDLRGLRIASPTAPGLYIRRCGSQVDKILVR